MGEMSIATKLVDASNFGGPVGELAKVGVTAGQLDREMGLGLNTVAQAATTFTKQEHGLAHLLNVPPDLARLLLGK